MRIPRIYLNQTLDAGQEVQLDSRSTHYLASVLRMKPGMQLVLFNGSGLEYHGTINTLEKKAGAFLVEKSVDPQTESRLVTTLAIGISRGERMDYVIQKSTELGVSTIQPLFTERCEVKLDDKRSSKRLEHWSKVSISACEQSGRVVLPTIEQPTSLEMWLASEQDYQARFLLDLNQERELADISTPESVAMLIGPEGGLSENEKALAIGKGFIGLKLGSRTLRTETAPVAALSLFQYLWGS